eukprot:SAG31_NODE_9979_length_1201_cov_1.690563_1_plen_157_part_00
MHLDQNDGSSANSNGMLFPSAQINHPSKLQMKSGARAERLIQSKVISQRSNQQAVRGCSHCNPPLRLCIEKSYSGTLTVRPFFSSCARQQESYNDYKKFQQHRYYGKTEPTSRHLQVFRHQIGFQTGWVIVICSASTMCVSRNCLHIGRLHVGYMA